MKIALALREARLTAGMQLKELARHMQASPGFVADLESGRRPFHDRYIDRLPESVRAPVAAALVAEHEATIDKLTAEHLMKE